MAQATPFRRNAGMKVSPMASKARPFTSGKDRCENLAAPIAIDRLSHVLWISVAGTRARIRCTLLLVVRNVVGKSISLNLRQCSVSSPE